MKLLHLIKKSDVLGLFAKELDLQSPEKIVKDLELFTTSFFCTSAKTTVGEAALSVLPFNTSCLNMVLALSDIMEMSNLQVPSASNNVRLRLRKDAVVQGNLRKRVREIAKELTGFVAIPREM